MVGLNGLEPSTSRLSGVRSNQLSYKPTMQTYVSNINDTIYFMILQVIFCIFLIFFYFFKNYDNFSLDFALRSSPARTPFLYKKYPHAAIIVALSVQYFISG